MAERIESDQQEKQRVVSTIDAEVAAIEDDDIEGYLAVLTEDALFLQPGLP